MELTLYATLWQREMVALQISISIIISFFQHICRIRTECLSLILHLTATQSMKVEAALI